MKNITSLIDIYLKDPNCTMFVPGHTYKEDENGRKLRNEQIKRSQDMLNTLERTISSVMKQRHQQELTETLENKLPVMYVDCSKKGLDNIMLFILKEYLHTSTLPQKNKLLIDLIGNHSIVHENKAERMKNVVEHSSTTKGIFDYYDKLLNTLCYKQGQVFKDRLLNMEADLCFYGLGRLMTEEHHKYLYLYLDKASDLDASEQKRINTFLYTRGCIPHDRWIRVKINDGKGGRKTRSSISEHRVEAIHDYSEVSIYEDQLKEVK